MTTMTMAIVATLSVLISVSRLVYALIQLLDPPFDKSDLNPGYIKVGRQPATLRPVPSRGLGGVQGALPLSGDHLPHHRFADELGEQRYECCSGRHLA